MPPSCRTLPVLMAVATVLSLGARPAAAGEEPQGPWRLVGKVPVAPSAWSWNWASWDQEKIATCGDAGCMALDSGNRPHVVTYKLPSPRSPDQLRHDPPPDIRKDLRFVHYRRAGGGFRCLEARAADGWQRWRSYPLPGKGVSGRDASKHDRRRWANEGILSFSAQLGRQEFGVVDLRLRRE